MNIVLALMVKNEAPIIERLLNSVKEHISAYIIVDSGSTDNTKELCAQLLDGIDGKIIDSEWMGYGKTRTLVHKLCRDNYPGMHHMVIDADEELTWTGEIKANIPVYRCQVAHKDTDKLHPRAFLLSGDYEWIWTGHEHHKLTGYKNGECTWPDPDANRDTMTSAVIMHHADGATWRAGIAQKYKEKAHNVEAELLLDPENGESRALVI